MILQPQDEIFIARLKLHKGEQIRINSKIYWLGEKYGWDNDSEYLCVLVDVYDYQNHYQSIEAMAGIREAPGSPLAGATTQVLIKGKLVTLIIKENIIEFISEKNANDEAR